ncbi:MAG: hypothetical protein RLP44_08135 [Aggregatilineales bacterium]
MKRTVFFIILGMLVLFTGLTVTAQDDSASADDESAEVIVELFSSPDSERRFNVPVPNGDGWVNLSEGDTAHFQNNILFADIYVTAMAGTAVEDNIDSTLSDLIDGYSEEAPTPFATAQVNLGGTRWTQELFQLADGRDITAFGGIRGENTYLLIYVNGDPESDYYNLITQQTDEADLDEGIAEALLIFDASFDGTPDAVDTVELSNGEWTRQVYDDANIRLIAQERLGNVTYIAIERGDGHLLDGMNKQFLTVFLGFFLTPANDPYLILGIVATAVLMLGLIGSYFLRQRNLQKDIALIQQLREDN